MKLLRVNACTILILIMALSLFSCGGGNTESGPGVTPELFFDDFSTDTTGNYQVTKGYDPLLDPEPLFLYDAAGKRAQMLTADNVSLAISTGVTSTDTATFMVDFLPTASYPTHGAIWLTLMQDANNYYEVVGIDKIDPNGIDVPIVRKVVNGSVVDSQPLSNFYSQNVNYRITINFSPQQVVVSAFGSSATLNGNSTAIQVNSFEIKLGQQDGYIDNIVLTDKPVVTLTVPQNGDFQWGHKSLQARADAFNLNPGEGIKFTLDGGGPITDTTKPYAVTFTNLTGGFHSVTAIAVNGTGSEISGAFTWDQAVNVEVGDYYVAMGDSITRGNHDSIPYPNGGYEPLLETQLKGFYIYDQKVVNEGISGHESVDGVTRIPTLLNNHPEAAYFLILYGSNDAINSVSAATFKANMESIIVSIINDGREPYLSKVPFNSSCPSCDPFIQAYNTDIDQLAFDYGITVTPPDFYNHFKNNPGELDDGLHPNHTGYQSMADLWFTALTP